MGSPKERLCKTLVLENLSVPTLSSCEYPLGWTKENYSLAQSRYIAVVVPYVHKLEIPALSRFVRRASPSGLVKSDTQALPNIVHAENGEVLTGFPFNGISVFGGKIGMPIILCKAILEAVGPSYIWLGGGEVDLKLRIPIAQLAAYSHVCDCSVERPSFFEED